MRRVWLQRGRVKEGVAAKWLRKGGGSCRELANRWGPLHIDHASIDITTAVAAIHRIGSACNSTSAVQAAFNTLERELKLLKYPPMIIRRALWRVRNTDDRWHAIRMSRAGAKCSDLSVASRQGGVRHTPSRRVPPGASNFAEWPVRRSRNLKV